MRNEQEDAIDKALAALRNVAPPEGMEVRIAHHLEAHASASQRDTTAAHVWWRGAACGAAVATLGLGGALFIQHRSLTVRRASQTISHVAPMPNAAVLATAYAESGATGNSRGIPCAMPAARRARVSFAPSRIELPTPAELHAATTAPSKPAPELPLTAQERELVRLARTASPKDLAVLDDETQAKQDAEDEAKFEQFFTPPPVIPPPTPADNE